MINALETKMTENRNESLRYLGKIYRAGNACKGVIEDTNPFYSEIQRNQTLRDFVEYLETKHIAHWHRQIWRPGSRAGSDRGYEKIIVDLKRLKRYISELNNGDLILDIFS